MEVGRYKRYSYRNGTGVGGNITKMDSEFDKWKGKITQEKKSHPLRKGERLNGEKV